MTKIISVAIGMLITLMITLNGTLANATGNYTSSMLIHFLGLVGTIIVMIMAKTKLKLRNNLSWYVYTGGVIGVLTVLFNNLSFATLGVSLTVALGLLGQSLSSLIIDHYGLLGMKKIPFESKKIIGLLLIIAGIVVMAFY
ncbi:MAG: DMT family transporter [Vagococcus sp.]|uniref:DMT family transporter n=1 Tax=Vagococcus sp. TaxID=1933889 RepID=UPI002FC7CCD9